MMKRLVVLLSALLLAASLPAAVLDLGGAIEWAYDTNAFSAPLPVGYPLDSGYPNGGEFLKRHSIGLQVDLNAYGDAESRIGFSSSISLRFPVSSRSIIPEGEGYDWEYREENSLYRQHMSLFIGAGPVFRFAAGGVDILLPIRFSLGSYDWFTSGVVVGAMIEPGLSIHLSDSAYLSFALIYDAHLMKFYYSMNQIYDPGYIMLTAGARIGAGFRFGG